MNQNYTNPNNNYGNTFNNNNSSQNNYGNQNSYGNPTNKVNSGYQSNNGGYEQQNKQPVVVKVDLAELDSLLELMEGILKDPKNFIKEDG